MINQPHTDVDEKRQSLWLLAWPPAIWAAHFLGSYALAAVWCRGNSPGSSWLGLSIATSALVAIALIGYAGWIGWQKHNIPGGKPSHDGDNNEDRTRFLGFATVLLAALSAMATAYTSVAALIAGACG
jgi:hypothetical protein